MTHIEDKFARLGTDHAPGQEVRQTSEGLDRFAKGEKLEGRLVDFSHGDVNEEAFSPTPGALDEFVAGVRRGGSQAYTEYRGGAELREALAQRLSRFVGFPVSAATDLIVTPGTQGALFLAIASCVSAGDKVAIVQPDYFANRKLVEFMGGKIVPVQTRYLDVTEKSGLDLAALEQAFVQGARVFLFSNPCNPTGVIYSAAEIAAIAALAGRFGVTVVVDQLYSRLLYPGRTYTHFGAHRGAVENLITIMGPSKTESLSGYRLGVGFGTPRLIERMEKLQAIVSLRAPGYSQAALRTWFAEPLGWMEDRVAKHAVIRDSLVKKFCQVRGLSIRSPEAGSYVFPRMPELSVPLHAFVQLLKHQANVIVTPGTEFSPHALQSIRLNFSQNAEATSAAVDRTVALIERYRA